MGLMVLAFEVVCSALVLISSMRLTDLSGEKLTAWNELTCNQYATQPVTHNTVVCDFRGAMLI